VSMRFHSRVDGEWPRRMQDTDTTGKDNENLVRTAETNNMTRFLGVWDSVRRTRRIRRERTKRQFILEHLERRVVLDAGLTPGTSTAVNATAGTLVTGAPLVTFTDGAAPLPANDYSATIDWGDGTPLSGGTISVSGTTFTVAGSHNFAQPSTGQPGGAYTLTLEIVGDGQQMSESTTATVDGLTYGFQIPVILPIALAPVQVAAGTPTSGLGVGPFQASPLPDPTAYSAVVDWGDGSTPTAATIEATGGGAIDAETSGYTYAAAGDYTVTTTIRDTQGFVVGTGTQVIYVFNPTAAPTPSLTATAGIPTGSLAVAEIAAGPYIFVEPAVETAAASTVPLQYNLQSTYYTAVVDWGDGSPPVAASLTPSTPYTTGVTTSGHTYAQGGTYTLTLTVRDSEGVVVDMVNPAITVSDPLSGRLSPKSDTGVSQNDGITNMTTPTFIGYTAPGAIVEVFAAPAGSASQPGSLIATGTADGSGVWSATAVNQPMADGTYTITGKVVNSSGAVLAYASLGSVVIDTIGPVVESVTLSRSEATAVITYNDNLSGLDLASVSNLAFYHLSAKPLSGREGKPRLILPKSVTVTPRASATSPDVVTLAIPRKVKALRAGRYLLEINSGVSGNGVEDVAGNALVGKPEKSFGRVRLRITTMF
jgi:PKD repeat protein